MVFRQIPNNKKRMMKTRRKNIPEKLFPEYLRRIRIKKQNLYSRQPPQPQLSSPQPQPSSPQSQPPPQPQPHGSGKPSPPL